MLAIYVFIGYTLSAILPRYVRVGGGYLSMKNYKNILVRLDLDLDERFKIILTRRRVSQQRVIVKFIKDYIKEYSYLLPLEDVDKLVSDDSE